jgi:predicted nucleotidyltransferase
VDQGSLERIVDRFRCELEKAGVRPEKIILFGSQATGTASESSDIDLVVLSSDVQGKTFWERNEILADVIYRLFVPIEAVAMTHEEWAASTSSIREYARDGKILYAA